MNVFCTREHSRNLAMIELLSARGLTAVSFPLIKTSLVEVDNREEEILLRYLTDSSSLICILSPASVIHLVEFLRKIHLKSGVNYLGIHRCKIAVQGRATQEEWQSASGEAATFLSCGPTGRDLARTIIGSSQYQIGDIERVLIVGPTEPRFEIDESFLSAGVPFDRLSLYSTRPCEASDQNLKLFRVSKPCAVVFFSPSGVRAFCEFSYHTLNSTAYYGAFGPTTAQALTDNGLKVSINHKESSIENFVEEIESFVRLRA